MSASGLSETQEWVAHRIESWVETYKKSMLTPVVLQHVADHEPTTVGEIAHHVASSTEWQITERGLYRTLKRLQDQGILAAVDVSAPRTGAKRKELTLTPLGMQLLSGITANLIHLPNTPHQD